MRATRAFDGLNSDSVRAMIVAAVGELIDALTNDCEETRAALASCQEQLYEESMSHRAELARSRDVVEQLRSEHADFKREVAEALRAEHRSALGRFLFNTTGALERVAQRLQLELKPRPGASP